MSTVYSPMAGGTRQAGVYTPMAGAAGQAGGEETMPLIHICMTDELGDDEKWHFLLEFPFVTGDSRAGFDEPMPDPEGWATNIFTESARVIKPDLTQALCGASGAPTQRQFHEAVRRELIDILSGPHCGFELGTHVNSNEDAIYLLVSLSDPEAQRQIADNISYRRSLHQGCWPADEYPTDLWSAGGFVKGPAATYIPHYEPYSIKRQGMFESLREPDLIRLIRKRMREFVSLERLVTSGVCKQIFPVHRYFSLNPLDIGIHQLYERGWNDARQVFQYPGHRHVNDVRRYFGEEFGFFFHWCNYTTRFLLFFPAPAGLAIFVSALYRIGQGDGSAAAEHGKVVAKVMDNASAAYKTDMNDTVMARAVCLFAAAMVIWGSIYTKLYERRANFKVLEWGMTNYNEVASVRRNYSQQYRGTCKDYLQQAAHWLLALLFVAETLTVVAVISAFHKEALQNPDGVLLFGMSGAVCSKLSKYLITANINVVDMVWSLLSPWLTDKENWRTDQACKQAKIMKLFFVKSVVFYYPFIYTAFLKYPMEGCHGGQEACVDELRANLFVNYITQMVLSVIGILVPMLKTYWKVHADRNKDKPISYLEFQAHCAPYVDDTDDFLTVILELGFVLMFTIVMPIMPFLSLVKNLIALRMLAFKYSFLSQRPLPRGSEGIGAWFSIVQGLSYVGVTCNVALVVFVLPPLRHCEVETQLIIFILVERGLHVLKRAIDGLMGAKSAIHSIIEEHVADRIDQILCRNSDRDVQAPAQPKPPLAMDAATQRAEEGKRKGA